jgi:hypothetical protein
MLLNQPAQMRFETTPKGAASDQLRGHPNHRPSTPAHFRVRDALISGLRTVLIIEGLDFHTSREFLRLQ